MTEAASKPSQYLGPGPTGRTFEAVNKPSGGTVAAPRVSKLDYTYAADALAVKAGVPATLVSALVNAESAWNPKAVSSAGAVGLGQFILSTATDYGLAGAGFDNRADAALNLTATALYLADLKASNGTWRAAIGEYSGQGPSLSSYAGYSAGQVLITTIDSLDGVTQPPPPPPTTGDNTYVGTLQNSAGQSLTVSLTETPSAATARGKAGPIAVGTTAMAMLIGAIMMAPHSTQVSAVASSPLPERSEPARLFPSSDAGKPQQSFDFSGSTFTFDRNLRPVPISPGLGK